MIKSNNNQDERLKLEMKYQRIQLIIQTVLSKILKTSNQYFQNEQRQTVQKQNNVLKNRDSVKNFLIKAFDEGDRDMFMAIWKIKDLFSSNNQSQDFMSTKKVEFYLEIYFTVYPISPLRTNNYHSYQQELLIFKNFIESQGFELSQTSEFVTYYALPYVPNPIEHKSFKHLFVEDFNQQLKQKLIEHIQNHISNKIDLDKIQQSLLQIIASTQDHNGRQNKILQTENEQLKQVIQDLQQKLIYEFDKQTQIEQLLSGNKSNLAFEIAKILNINFEDIPERQTLTASQEDSQSQYISESHRYKNNKNQVDLQKSGTIKQNPFNQEVHSHSQGIINEEQNLFQSHQKKFNNYTGDNSDGKSQQQNEKSQSQLQINLIPSYIVGQMKKDLILSNDILHLQQILKQVRENIKKNCSESKTSRKETFKHLFINHDLFCLGNPLLLSQKIQNDNQYSNTDFIDKISILQSDSLNFQFIYLVNVMSCEPLGIQYLSQKKLFLKQAIWQMIQISQVKNIDKLCIAIFQKFSLKKKFCIQMLKFGIVEWLLEKLQTIKQNQQYELQYGLALLMNLTLHDLGQKLFAKASIDVLEVLMMHFNTITEQELETCINGSIYCLMNIKLLRNKARINGLRESLEERLKTTNNEQVMTQIRHIISKMDDCDNDDDEQDNIIQEADNEDEDEQEQITNNNQEISQKEQNDDYQESEFQDNDNIKEEEDDYDDDNMSISDFSNDQDYVQYNVKKEDTQTYFENRMLNFRPQNTQDIIYKLPLDDQKEIHSQRNRNGSNLSQQSQKPLKYDVANGTQKIQSASNNESFLNKTKSSQISSQLPLEMKPRDKIPRTPIDPDLLDQIKKDNLRLQKDYDLIKPTKKKKIRKNLEKEEQIIKVGGQQDLHQIGEELLRNEFSLKKGLKNIKKTMIKFILLRY